jgi:RNA polymerase sigma-70 factor (ECF subfamily)
MPEPAIEPDSSDEELACQTQAGDLLAFEQLVSRYEGRLYQFLRLKTADPRDAEELTQSTLITAYRKIHLYKPKHAFATWLFTIARRLTIDDYRRNKNRPLSNALPEESAINALVESRNPADLVSESEEHSALWLSIRAILNDHQFTAMWLKYEQDLPIAEIATAMKKTNTHVKVILHRARQSLITQLSATDAGGAPSTISLPSPLKH